MLILNCFAMHKCLSFLAKILKLYTLPTIFLITQVLVLVFFNLFFKFNTLDQNFFNNINWYFHLSVMIYIGFSLKEFSTEQLYWNSISKVFIIVGITIQEYFILSFIIEKNFNFNTGNKYVIDSQQLLRAIGCCFSALISISSNLSFLKIEQILVLILFHCLGYTLNQHISINLLKVQDSGGAIYIHTFASVFTITVSTIISGKQTKKIETTTQVTKVRRFLNSLGQVFIFVLWPLLIAGNAPTLFRAKLAIFNSILAIVGGCFGAMIVKFYSTQQIQFRDIIIGSFSGAVSIASLADILNSPGLVIFLGSLGGLFSILLLNLIQNFQDKLGIMDRSFALSTHFLPALFSTLAIIIFELTLLQKKQIELYQTTDLFYNLIQMKSQEFIVNQFLAFMYSVNISLVVAFTGAVVCLIWRKWSELVFSHFIKEKDNDQTEGSQTQRKLSYIFKKNDTITNEYIL